MTRRPLPHTPAVAAWLAALAALAASTAALAEPFEYLPPGDLIQESGEGRVDETVYAPGMRFPIAEGPAFANSQVYNPGGYLGPPGGQCDGVNYDYPWRDNYCEIRQWDMPLCPAGTGHQGQDIRPATCDAGVHTAVAAADGTITNIGSYSVYLTDAEGTRYDYLHMSNVMVSVGEAVTKGQPIGRVSNEFGGTPTTIHLHFNLRQNVAGVGNVYVPPYMSLVASYQALVNEPPEGFLDAVECSGIRGWTHDPSMPEGQNEALLYFDGAAGDPGAEGHAIPAGVHREDLCAALGSCEHGFAVELPLSLLGKGEHAVRAYGTDLEGGPPAELEGSPKTFACPLEIPEGVRRHVIDPASMEAWRFSSFWDVASVSDEALEALPEGADLPAAPVLMRSDDGAPEVWLQDGETRRHVPSPEIAAAWELDPNDVVTRPADVIAAMPEGPPLRPRPFLVQGAGPAVYLVDDARDGQGPGVDPDGAAPRDEEALEGQVACGCRAAGADAAAPPWALGLALAGLAAGLRRAQRGRRSSS